MQVLLCLLTGGEWLIMDCVRCDSSCDGFAVSDARGEGVVDEAAGDVRERTKRG